MNLPAKLLTQPGATNNVVRLNSRPVPTSGFKVVTATSGSSTSPSAPTSTTLEARVRLMSLISRITRRDQAALAEFYDLTIDRLFSLAVSILQQSQDAEEVCEDVYTYVWHNANQYDEPRGTVMTWLLLVCRSRALDRLRSKRRYEGAVAQSMLEALDSDEEISIDETFNKGSRLQEALATLPTDERQFVLLSYFRGLTHSEIAAFKRMPIGSVKTKLHRALTRLREFLDESPATSFQTPAVALSRGEAVLSHQPSET